MELGAHVWLRKEASHWGWVPAVVTKKESVTLSGVELIKLTVNDDPIIEVTMPSQSTGESDYRRSGSQYFTDEERFEVVVTVDPEQLKTADHDDIKLRNLPNSFHLSGEDSEAGVLISPSNHVDSDVVGGVNDLIGLTHLHEPAILHALRLRYDADIIYTATGPILIALNPFKKMDIYSNHIMEQYCLQGEQKGGGTQSNGSTYTTPFKNRRLHGQAAPETRLSPHAYQTADDAYRAMMRGMENRELMRNPKQLKRGQSAIPAIQRDAPSNQSILVSGESGAGKTVTTKIVLNYFAMLSKRRAEMTRATPGNSPQGRRPDEVSIEQQVLQSNPILESFGNARTIRNDNSSRFGKYIDIRFTRSGKLSGASIDTYLLEKVRLIHPGAGERNYHVFYQFLKAATPQERHDFFLGGMIANDFRLLSQSGTYDRRDGVSDEDNHQEMLDALVSANETLQSIWYGMMWMEQWTHALFSIALLLPDYRGLLP
jgi:myosin heavy subunit